jgi:EF-P beta-lysylation protein EpmB
MLTAIDLTPARYVISMAILVSRASPNPTTREEQLWQHELRQAVRDVDELCNLLGISPSELPLAHDASRRFPLLVPRGFVARMQPGNPRDPLLLQVLPLAHEDRRAPGFITDPVADLAAQVVPGLLHKYRQRTLIVATGACAVHCRYCFRRNFPYQESPDIHKLWQTVVRQTAANSAIHEVILSGGDPLMLPDHLLRALVEQLAGIEHLRRIRVHTRLPIVLPSRVNEELLTWLRGTRLTPVLVIHANHPAELSADVARAVTRLADVGIPVFNQAVLLRGINDDVNVLAELCERLIDLRATPYYLHQLDRVSGAAHFEVDQATGEQLIRALRERLPGYAVPRYVREVAGQPSKTILA